MNEFFKIDKRILDASDKALKLCKEQFENIEKITEYNIVRVDEYFKNEKPIETPEGKKNRQKQEAERMQGKLF